MLPVSEVWTNKRLLKYHLGSSYFLVLKIGYQVKVYIYFYSWRGISFIPACYENIQLGNVAMFRVPRSIGKIHSTPYQLIHVDYK